MTLPHFKASLLLLLLAVAGGCGTAKVANPLTEKLAGNEPDQQLEFWHTLATRSITSNDEAFHGLLLFLDSQDAAKDYAGRVEALKERKMLPDDFDFPADHAVQRGTLAVAICRILEIRGGYMLHLFPRSPRYAVRELQYMELFPPSSPRQTFTGQEFLAIIGRIEDYQRSNKTPAGRLAGLSGPSPADRSVLR